MVRLLKWRGEILVELLNITALATEVFVPVSEMTILKVLEFSFLNHELSDPVSYPVWDFQTRPIPEQLFFVSGPGCRYEPDPVVKGVLQ